MFVSYLVVLLFFKLVIRNFFSMANYSYQGTPPGKTFLSDVMHILVLAILLIVLMVILTKFKVVHPSVVPGWQGVYCTYIEGKHSQVAIISSKTGSGDAAQLLATISNERPDLRVSPIAARDLSPQLLSRFELVILEQSKDISFKSMDALQSYLDKGGSMVWTGDSLSNQQPDASDIAEARQRNETEKNFSSKYGGQWASYYDYFLDRTKQPGFGSFGEQFIGSYIATTPKQNSALKIILDDHLLVTGLVKDLPLKPGTKVTQVNTGSGLALIASIPTGIDDEEIPGIVEQKYVGRIIYVAAPLTAIDSKTFRQNLYDYLVTC